MTVRELINKLMDLDLDKPVYITVIDQNAKSNCVGFINMDSIKLSDQKIIDVDIHGVYGERFNCITIQ